MSLTEQIKPPSVTYGDMRAELAFAHMAAVLRRNAMDLRVDARVGNALAQLIHGRWPEPAQASGKSTAAGRKTVTSDDGGAEPSARKPVSTRGI